MIALAFPRKAMHCSICLMNSSLYMHEISQIRSTPDKVGLCDTTKAMLAMYQVHSSYIRFFGRYRPKEQGTGG